MKTKWGEGASNMYINTHIIQKHILLIVWFPCCVQLLSVAFPAWVLPAFGSLQSSSWRPYSPVFQTSSSLTVRTPAWLLQHPHIHKLKTSINGYYQSFEPWLQGIEPMSTTFRFLVLDSHICFSLFFMHLSFSWVSCDRALRVISPCSLMRLSLMSLVSLTTCWRALLFKSRCSLFLTCCWSMRSCSCLRSALFSSTAWLRSDGTKPLVSNAI